MSFSDQFSVMFAFMILGIFLLPVIFFCISEQKLLKAIQPQNRTMQPNEVWLQLIPIFGLVWQFIVVNRISDSIKKELWQNDFSFENRPDPHSYTQARPAYSIGIAYCILFCCSIIPCIGVVAWMAGLVCWIIYWVQLGEFRRDIERKNFVSYYPPQPPADPEYPQHY